MKVFIMRGLSGSGKSTAAAKLAEREKVGDAYVSIISSDDYFTDENGKYVFNPKLLNDAHASCMRRFIDAIINKDSKDDVVIVDNTSTTVWEISPYVLVAQAFMIEPEIVTVSTPLSDGELAARNHHGVPASTIAAQRKRINENPLPPWWRNRKA